MDENSLVAQRILETIENNGGELIGDCLPDCIDWVSVKTNAYLCETPLSDMAKDYMATFDEIDPLEWGDLMIARN